MAAQNCLEEGCKNKTNDASGRCYAHRHGKVKRTPKDKRVTGISIANPQQKVDFQTFTTINSEDALNALHMACPEINDSDFDNPEQINEYLLGAMMNYIQSHCVRSIVEAESKVEEFKKHMDKDPNYFGRVLNNTREGIKQNMKAKICTFSPEEMEDMLTNEDNYVQFELSSVHNNELCTAQLSFVSRMMWEYVNHYRRENNIDENDPIVARYNIDYPEWLEKTYKEQYMHWFDDMWDEHIEKWSSLYSRATGEISSLAPYVMTTPQYKEQQELAEVNRQIKEQEKKLAEAERLRDQARAMQEQAEQQFADEVNQHYANMKGTPASPELSFKGAVKDVMGAMKEVRQKVAADNAEKEKKRRQKENEEIRRKRNYLIRDSYKKRNRGW